VPGDFSGAAFFLVAGTLVGYDSIPVAVDEPPDFVFRGKFQTDWEGYSSTNIQPLTSARKPSKLSEVDHTALALDGIDDKVALGHSYNSPQSQLTVEVLFRTEENGAIISFDRNEWFRMEVGGQVDDQCVGICYKTDSGVVDNFGGNRIVTDGRWHHAAFVFDGGTGAFYVDGTFVDGNSTGSTVGDSGSAIRYGYLGTLTEAPTFADFSGQGRFFNGLISEVRLWNVARSNAEISENIERTLDGNESGLVGYWRAQEVTSDTLPDKANNGGTGQIYGADRHIANVTAALPFDVSSSPASRDADGYGSPSDLIDDGYDYLAQPVPLSASFEEVYDTGAVVPSTKVEVSLGQEQAVPFVQSIVTVSTRETQDEAWEVFPQGQRTVYATQFRYVRIQVEYSADNANAFLLASEINTTLSTKMRNDSGYVSVDQNPTTVEFNTSFVDVTSIALSVNSTNSLNAVYDFTDEPYPKNFDIYLFDGSGNAVTGDVSWQARGI